MEENAVAGDFTILGNLADVSVGSGFGN